MCTWLGEEKDEEEKEEKEEEKEEEEEEEEEELILRSRGAWCRPSAVLSKPVPYHSPAFVSFR